MVSKKVMSLHAWLARAEEVLHEQREQSLSPSSTGHFNRTKYETTVTLATFEKGLAKLIDQLCSRPGRWKLIAEDACSTDRSLQVLAYEDGSLILEVADRRILGGVDRPYSTDEGILTQLGWNAPHPAVSPNWQRVEPTTSPPVAEVAQLAIRTLRQVFKLGDEDELSLATFALAERGSTAAGERAADWVVDLPPAVVGQVFIPPPEPWADYFRQLFPGHAHPESEFDAWKYASTGVNVTRALWDARERIRAQWESEQGSDPSAWPVVHPPLVVWMPMAANPACLQCTWIGSSTGSSVELAGSHARDHSIEHGSDADTVRRLQVPIGQRYPPDKRLQRTWV